MFSSLFRLASSNRIGSVERLTRYRKLMDLNWIRFWLLLMCEENFVALAAGGERAEKGERYVELF